MSEPQQGRTGRTGFFDHPGNVRWSLRVFFAVLGALLIVDFFVPRHPHFFWEEAPGFYAAYGFVSCLVLALAARVLRFFIKRGEDYYDR